MKTCLKILLAVCLMGAASQPASAIKNVEAFATFGVTNDGSALTVGATWMPSPYM